MGDEAGMNAALLAHSKADGHRKGAIARLRTVGPDNDAFDGHRTALLDGARRQSPPVPTSPGTARRRRSLVLRLDDRSTSPFLPILARRAPWARGWPIRSVHRARCGPVPLGRAVKQVRDSTAIAIVADPDTVGVVEAGPLGNRLLGHHSEESRA